MDQQGKGRGRGAPAQNVWTNRAEVQSKNSKAGRPQNTSNPLSKEKSHSTRKFEEACAEIKANVDKHVAKLSEGVGDSSSEEEETNNDTDIISTVFNLYGKSSTELAKVEQVLKDSLRSGTSVCLICIDSVKKSDFIWSCAKCYCTLHLSCIQRWAKDSIYFQTEAASDHLAPGQHVNPRKFNWCW
jgi:NF-X1-type zinc finger protein NFXL1